MENKVVEGFPEDYERPSIDDFKPEFHCVTCEIDTVTKDGKIGFRDNRYSRHIRIFVICAKCGKSTSLHEGPKRKMEELPPSPCLVNGCNCTDFLEEGESDSEDNRICCENCPHELHEHKQNPKMIEKYYLPKTRHSSLKEGKYKVGLEQFNLDDA